MKRKPLDGKNLMLWLGDKVVALSKSCSLSIDIQIGDGNTKDDGLWDSGDIVGAGWTMDNQSVDSADAAIGTDLVYDQLFEAMLAAEPIIVSMGVPSNASNDDVPASGWLRPTSGYYTGKARITNLSRSGDKGSQGSVTISLKGVGPLKKQGSGSGN